MKYILMIGTLLAGALLPLQNILNSRLGRQSGGSLMGVLISFVIGTAFLFLINASVNPQAFAMVKPSKITPWFIWLGGVLFLGYTTWVNGQQSLALTFIFIVIGQIIMALLIDHFGWLGAAVKPISTAQFVGVLLIFAGIILVKK